MQTMNKLSVLGDSISYNVCCMTQSILRSPSRCHSLSSIAGMYLLMLVTSSNYMLSPMRDAAAITVGVESIPKLAFISTLLTLGSSALVGWLFEAPDPKRRKIFSRVGLTRGDTQGTSLALFFRMFAFYLMLMAAVFKGLKSYNLNSSSYEKYAYASFYLGCHLMKLHAVSLVWGVATEAMELEERSDSHEGNRQRESVKNIYSRSSNGAAVASKQSKLSSLSFVALGGTAGSIMGSAVCATYAKDMKFEGMLLLSGVILETSARLAVVLGKVMQIHWNINQVAKVRSTNDLRSFQVEVEVDSSLNTHNDASNSTTMKRVGSGNSLNKEMMRRRSRSHENLRKTLAPVRESFRPTPSLANFEADSFGARLLRGIITILQSRLLITIFTYNALYASTTTMLSFQRASLVEGRKGGEAHAEDHTAFLACINMASSLAVLLLQATALGPKLASFCGMRGTLMLLPTVRLAGVAALVWWANAGKGKPPSLAIFLALDEFTRVINLAVAKPVREGLWRGLSNEARYEAKPLVDTLANRWGGGSAAFLVSAFSYIKSGPFGVPPSLILIGAVAAWWEGVAWNLGRVRRRIDEELKAKKML